MKKVLSIFLAFLLLMTLTVPCFADEPSDSRFAPCVTAKDAPRLVPLEGDVLAQIYRVNETEEEKLIELNENAFGVTPYAKADEAGDIGTALKNAYQEIQNAESLSALNAELDQIAKALHDSYTAQNLVVSDLFDVSPVDDEVKAVLSESNTYIRIRFDIDKAADTFNPVVMHRPSDEIGWVSVPLANVVDNGDGTVTVKLDSLCPITFLSVVAPEDENPSSDPAPTPDKDDEPLSREFWWLLFLFGIVLLIIITMLIAALANSQRTYYEYKMQKEIEENREKRKNKKPAEDQPPVEEVVEVAEKAHKKEKRSKKAKKSGKGVPAEVSVKDVVAAGLFTLYSALIIKFFLYGQNKKK